ncbi:MAG: amidohydrolase family protein [Rhizobiaceae bacterium]
MLIDWHTNLWLPEHVDGSKDGLLDQGEVGFRYPGDAAAFAEHVAKTAERFVVLTMYFPRMGLRVPNEFVAAEVARYPGRAIGLACVDPFEPNAPRKLEHAVAELGMRGLKWSPVYGGFDPWCPEAWAIYSTCDRLGIPMLWHQSAAFSQFSVHEYANPTLIDRIARTYPNLKMIIAHIGQPWVEECIVLLRKHPQLLADLSGRFHRPWQLYNAMMVAIEYRVTDRLLFGSDFPLRSTAEAMAEFRSLNDWGPDVRLPRIPNELIEDIITNRPLELVWPE